MNNCNENNSVCSTGCPEIVSGRCVKYTDKYLGTIIVGSSDTFNSAMIKINNYLQGIGSSILQKVTHQNTSSIILEGDGTVISPLTATYTGSTATSTLQEVNAAGNTTSIPMLITGNASTSIAGLYLGKNYIRSRGTGSTFDSLQIDGEDVQIVGNLTVLLQTTGGQIIVPQTGSKMILNSTSGINFISSGIIPAQFNTRVKGLNGTEADDFVTMSQLDDGAEFNNSYFNI